MRTQFFFVGLLSGVAGMLVGTAGCDDITAGQATDSSAPPQLVTRHCAGRPLRCWQFPNRASALDILDNDPHAAVHASPARATARATRSTPLRRSTTPASTSSSSTSWRRTCTASRPASATTRSRSRRRACRCRCRWRSWRRDRHARSGRRHPIRLVFDKVLDNSIETVSPMARTSAGQDGQLHADAASLIELDDPSRQARRQHDVLRQRRLVPVLGRPRAGSARSRPSSSSRTTRSTTRATYTVKFLNPGALKDREGNAAAGSTAARCRLPLLQDRGPDARRRRHVPSVRLAAGFDYPGLHDAADGFDHAERGHPDRLLRALRGRLGDGQRQEPLHRAPTPSPTATAATTPRCARWRPRPASSSTSSTGRRATSRRRMPVDWPMGDYDIDLTVRRASTARARPFTRGLHVHRRRAPTRRIR